MKLINTCLLIACSLVLLSGCHVARSSFQMDSNNPTPSLGLELAPRKKKQKIEHAEHVVPPRMDSPSMEEDAAKSDSRFVKWTRWLNPLAPAKHIPLPRTDVTEEEEDDVPEPMEPGTDF